MAERRHVLLADGRTGRIVRIDTTYPKGDTTVSIWTETPDGPGLAKVSSGAVVGPASSEENVA